VRVCGYLYIDHFTFLARLSTENLLSTLYSLLSTLYSLLSTLYSLLSTLYSRTNPPQALDLHCRYLSHSSALVGMIQRIYNMVDRNVQGIHVGSVESGRHGLENVWRMHGECIEGV
jgi:hypothetical protein